MWQTILDWLRGYGYLGRASDWSSWRNAHIDKKCRYCGTTKRLELHHKTPYHQNPELEKDPKNVITLCRDCHYKHGHLKSWYSWNKDIDMDCDIYNEQVKNRP